MHQRVEIIYVVDGYLAQLTHEEGYPYPRIEGEGKTLHEALENLDRKIPSGHPRDWRNME